MKKPFMVLWFLACIVALGLVFQQTRSYSGMDGPPPMTVECNGQTEKAGIWSAQWSSSTTGFTACGDPPSSPYARDWLKVLYASPGDSLTISFPVAPHKISVTLDYDDPEGEWSTRLYEGTGSTELTISLPENCGGAYDVWTEWLGLGSGNAAYGFLVVDSQREADILEQGPPNLTVAYWGDCEVTAWKGNYSWSMLDGDSGEAVIACGPHPLDVVDDLPVVEAREGDTLVLAFEAVPDKVEVEYFCGEDSALDAQSTPYEMAHGSMIHLQEGMEGTVWVVRGKWETGGTEGSVEYAFYVPS